MVIVIRFTVINVDNAEELILKGKVKYHRFRGRNRMGNVVNNGECVCKVKFDVNRNTDRVRVSKQGEIALPHIIIGCAWDASPKQVRVRMGGLNRPNPRFLDHKNVSS